MCAGKNVYILSKCMVGYVGVGRGGKEDRGVLGFDHPTPPRGVGIGGIASACYSPSYGLADHVVGRYLGPGARGAYTRPVPENPVMNIVLIAGQVHLALCELKEGHREDCLRILESLLRELDRYS